MVTVSVVVPCFRAASTVGRAVESVLRQTMPVRELILVDDCSDDGSNAVLQDLARAGGAGRVRILTLERNSGPATARNAGWNASSGSYVAFLDADDAWHPRKIELQHHFMSGQPDIAFSGHAHRWLRDGKDSPHPEPALGYAEVTRRALLLSNRFTTSSVMVRRALPHRFREGQRHMEDHLLWLTMMSAGLRAARLEAELSCRYFAPYGESGQSANLAAMQREELANYVRLYRQGAIGVGWLSVLLPWSLAKFARRQLISKTRRYRRERKRSTLAR